MRTALAILVLLSTLTTARAQTTWYVDAAGTAPGTGTLADPYVSIHYAVHQPTTLHGDTVLVAPGTYVENVIREYLDVDIRSTHGPVHTTLQGSFYLDHGPSAEGFTIHGSVILGDFTSLRHCVLIYVPGGDNRGIFHWGDLLIEHCTIVRFQYPIMQFAFDSGTPVIRSTISYGNGIGHAYGGTLFPAQFGGSDFWNATADDYHLAPGSALIDHGSPQSPLDPDGSPADLGAYAYDSTYAPDPAPYCVGKLNGQGCVPSIGASGVCSATGTQPFWVTATEVSSNKFGRLFYGSAQAAVPFVGGTRCVAAPFIRTPLSNSGGTGPCTGVLNYDFQAHVLGGTDPGLVPGRLVYAQYWYRDPTDPAGYGLGLSNAICFGIAP